MATILLIGSAEPALEGLAQALGAAGHRAHIASTLAEASEVASATQPLVVLAERRFAGMRGLLHLPYVRGGALVFFRADGDPAPALSAAVQRATLADLTLPLEQQRLLALVQHVDQRAVAAGRTGEHPVADKRAR